MRRTKWGVPSDLESQRAKLSLAIDWMDYILEALPDIPILKKATDFVMAQIEEAKKEIRKLEKEEQQRLKSPIFQQIEKYLSEKKKGVTY